MRAEINVNPTVVTWLIVRAGYVVDDFLKFPNVRGWIEQIKCTKVKQLEEFDWNYLVFNVAS